MDYDVIVDTILSSTASDWIESPGHEMKFLKRDVNLTIGSTLQNEDIQQENFREKWANQFPDERAVGYFYNIRYGSTLVDRVILVSVDGARAGLPVPELGSMNVPPLNWRVAQIFDNLDSLVDYAKQAGLVAPR